MFCNNKSHTWVALNSKASCHNYLNESHRYQFLWHRYFNCSAPGVQACGVPPSCCIDPLENGTVWNTQCGVGAQQLDEFTGPERDLPGRLSGQHLALDWAAQWSDCYSSHHCAGGPDTHSVHDDPSAAEDTVEQSSAWGVLTITAVNGFRCFQ